jgi:hypothetical protein
VCATHVAVGFHYGGNDQRQNNLTNMSNRLSNNIIDLRGRLAGVWIWNRS